MVAKVIRNAQSTMAAKLNPLKSVWWLCQLM